MVFFEQLPHMTLPVGNKADRRGVKSVWAEEPFYALPSTVTATTCSTYVQDRIFTILQFVFTRFFAVFHPRSVRSVLNAE